MLRMRKLMIVKSKHQWWKQGNQWLLEKILMLITSKLLIYKDKHQN